MKGLAIVLLTSLLFACSKETKPSPPGEKPLVFTVASEKVDCYGVVPMECLVVNGENFYDDIEGFDYQEGYEYVIEVDKFQLFPEDAVPADASMYGYKLRRVVSKKAK